MSRSCRAAAAALLLVLLLAAAMRPAVQITPGSTQSGALLSY